MVAEEVAPERKPGLGGLVRRAALDVSPLRDSPPFRRLWAGQSISYVGSEIAFVAVAIQLEGVYGNLGAVAGPALSGVLVAAIGFPLTYLLDVATFGMSLWSVWRLPALPPAEDADRASLRSIVEGFRYVRAKQALLGIFVVDTSAMVFGMPMALFP